MTTGTCATCRFRPETRCRRFPPIGAIGASALWPVTKPEDWCGEHRSAAEPARTTTPPFQANKWLSNCPDCGAEPAMECAPTCLERKRRERAAKAATRKSKPKA